jgi:hypothetical protein
MSQTKTKDAVISTDTGDVCEQLIEEHLRAQNSLEYALGDTLDIKTSIALVVITFLATQSASFLALNMPRHWHNIQVLSVICLCLAGLLAVVELVPRVYKVGLKPSEFATWVKGVQAFYNADAAHSEQRTLDFIRRKQIEQLERRFEHNSKLNARKSLAVTGSFYLTILALVLNLLTLLSNSMGWRF